MFQNLLSVSSIIPSEEVTASLRIPFVSQEVLLRSGILLLGGALLIPVVLKLLANLISRTKQLHFIQTYLLSSARIGLWFLLIVIVADSLGIPVNSIFALMGVAGLALSLALQNTLSNLAGGLQVLVSKPFVVGDYIDTDQGSGTVLEIGLAYSKLSTIDNKEVLIPNHLVAASKIINHTAAGLRRVDVVFSASYEASTSAVKTALIEMTKKIPQIHPDPEPVVYLCEFGESSISYSLRVWTSASDYWQVYFSILEEGREAFARHNIEIPYNHLNVHVVEHLKASVNTERESL